MMKVAVIEVKRTGEGDPLEFAVIVRVGDGQDQAPPAILKR
jgi:hypothetical protein